MVLPATAQGIGLFQLPTGGAAYKRPSKVRDISPAFTKGGRARV